MTDLSERAAWRTVLATAQKIKDSMRDPRSRQAEWAQNIMEIAADMLDQLGRGTHTNPRTMHSNPALAIWGNPGGSLRVTLDDLLSKRAFALSYKHRDDGLDYEHPFSPGVDVITVKLDGGTRGVLLVRRDGRELWKDF